ncbi:hypothetical protein Ciccas_007127 [Cichlidogyrus casuarinus]|uniref:Uncharacterized protein n=1 Tax=Cichlidogyrus casuarinus TaxID=1844966 RepID=A0ABD2Q3W4_9PLAT
MTDFGQVHDFLNMVEGFYNSADYKSQYHNDSSTSLVVCLFRLENNETFLQLMNTLESENSIETCTTKLNEDNIDWRDSFYALGTVILNHHNDHQEKFNTLAYVIEKGKNTVTIDESQKVKIVKKFQTYKQKFLRIFADPEFTFNPYRNGLVFFIHQIWEVNCGFTKALDCCKIFETVMMLEFLLTVLLAKIELYGKKMHNYLLLVYKGDKEKRKEFFESNKDVSSCPTSWIFYFLTDKQYKQFLGLLKSYRIKKEIERMLTDALAKLKNKKLKDKAMSQSFLHLMSVTALVITTEALTKEEKANKLDDAHKQVEEKLQTNFPDMKFDNYLRWSDRMCEHLGKCTKSSRAYCYASLAYEVYRLKCYMKLEYPDKSVICMIIVLLCIAPLVKLLQLETNKDDSLMKGYTDLEEWVADFIETVRKDAKDKKVIVDVFDKSDGPQIVENDNYLNVDYEKKEEVTELAMCQSFFDLVDGIISPLDYKRHRNEDQYFQICSKQGEEFAIIGGSNENLLGNRIQSSKK